MKIMSIMAASAVILMSTVAIAEDRVIEVPTPKSITIVCSDSVQPGTIVMSNPPKFACSDYELASKVIGTGITLGPDRNMNRIISAIRRTKRNQVASVLTKPWNSTSRGREVFSERARGAWQSVGSDDFDGSNSKINEIVGRRYLESGRWVNVAKMLEQNTH